MKGKIVKGGGAPDDDRPDSPSGGGGEAGKKVIKKDVHSAKEEGKQILDRAEEEASAIIRKAESEAGSIRDLAKAEGYEEGIAKLNELALRFQESRRRIFEEARDEILRLAVKIAGKILGRELESNDKAFTDLVTRAMRGVQGESRIQVRVNPSDLKKIQKDRKRLVEEVGQGREIELVEDAKVSEGGCVIETDLGIIDAQLETQLRVLEKALTERKPG